MKRFISIFSLLLVFASAWATDTTSISYKENQRVQRMVTLLNQQIQQNRYLPPYAKNFIIDGRKQFYNIPTLDTATYDAIHQKLRKVNQNEKDPVAFYVIIPPPLFTNIIPNEEDKRVAFISDNKSALYQKSKKDIQKFTNKVFARSEISRAQYKGILLNLDSFIDIDQKKKGDQKKTIQGARGSTFREFFYPCIAFGSRIKIATIRKAISHIRFASAEIGKDPRKLHNTFYNRGTMNQLVKVYVGTLSEMIQKGGGKDFQQDDVFKPQFQANLSAQLTQLKFGEIGKIKAYDASKAKVFRQDSILVRDHAGVFNGKIKPFLGSDPFLQQFLSKQSRFKLEIITTSDTSVAFSQQQLLSDIKGKTAHQIAYEPGIGSNVVRISMHFRHKGEKELITHWTMRLGGKLVVSKDGKTVEVAPPAGSIRSLGDLLNAGLQLLEKALNQVVKGLDRFKVPDTMWNDSTMVEPAKTILPLLAGVYNGAIEKIQEAPDDILALVQFLRNIINYVADSKYRQEVNKALDSFKTADLGDLIAGLIQEKIDKYKQYGKLHNPSYVVGNALVSLIFDAIKSGSGTGFLKMIQSSMTKLKKNRKGTGSGPGGGGNKKGNGNKKDKDDDKNKDDQKKDDKKGGNEQKAGSLISKKVKGKANAYEAYVIITTKRKGQKKPKEEKIVLGKMSWNPSSKQMKLTRVKVTTKVKSITPKAVLGKLLAWKKEEAESIQVPSNIKTLAKSTVFKHEYEGALYKESPVPGLAFNTTKTKAFLKKDNQEVGTLLHLKKEGDKQIKLEISDAKKLRPLIKKYKLKYEALLKDALKKMIPAGTEQIMLAKASKSKEWVNWAERNGYRYHYTRVSKVPQLKGVRYTKSEVLLFATSKNGTKALSPSWHMIQGSKLERGKSKGETQYLGVVGYLKDSKLIYFQDLDTKASVEGLKTALDKVKKNGGTSRIVKGIRANAAKYPLDGKFLSWVKKSFKYLYKTEESANGGKKSYYVFNGQPMFAYATKVAGKEDLMLRGLIGLDISNKNKVDPSSAELRPRLTGDYIKKYKSLKITLGKEKLKDQEQKKLLDVLWSELVTAQKQEVNVVFTSDDSYLKKFNDLGDNITQERLNTVGKATALGNWANQKKFLYTLVSRGNNKNSGNQGSITQVRFTKTACFVAGTPIFYGIDESTGQAHYKKIETVKPGDVLPAFNETNQAVGYQRVVRVFKNTAPALVKVYAQGKLALMPTPNHPFWINQEWVEAGNLEKGDSLWLYNGQQVAIDSVVRIDTTVIVYNFEVANYHTYFAGELGVGVHNDCVYPVNKKYYFGGLNNNKNKTLTTAYYDPMIVAKVFKGQTKTNNIYIAKVEDLKKEKIEIENIESGKFKVWFKTNLNNYQKIAKSLLSIAQVNKLLSDLKLQNKTSLTNQEIEKFYEKAYLIGAKDLVEAEERIKGLTFETGYAFYNDKKLNSILGKRDEKGLFLSMTELFKGAPATQKISSKGAIITHNHPLQFPMSIYTADSDWRGDSFSLDDIESTCQLSAKELRVVVWLNSQKTIYTLTKSNGQNFSSGEKSALKSHYEYFEEAINSDGIYTLDSEKKMFQTLLTLAKKRISAAGMNFDDVADGESAHLFISHEIWEIIFRDRNKELKQNLYIYKRL